MGRKKEPITFEQIMDFIDFMREGEEEVLICENADDRWNRVFTDSAILRGINDRLVNSIGAENDIVCIWLEDERLRKETVMKYTRDDLETIISLCELKEKCNESWKLNYCCRRALLYSNVSIRLTQRDKLFLESLYDKEMDQITKSTLDRILSIHNT